MRIFNKMKKTMLVLAASLFCANVAFADTKTVYSWESPDGTVVETGGKAASSANSWVKNGEVGVTEEHVNLKQTATDLTVDPSVSTDYWVMRLSGNNSHIDVVDQSTLAAADYGRCAHVVITLDQPLAEGDQITVTGFRNKNAANKVANLYIRFDNESGKVAELKDADDETPYANIHTEGGVDLDNDGNLPTSKTYTVPAEAAGLSKIVLTRSKSGTNVFITKLDITREEAAGGDETTGYDLTAYNEAVAAAEAYKATLNPEDEMDAMLIMSVEDLLGSAASWLEEVQADPEATQADVDFIAEDLTNNIALLKVQAEIEALRAEGQEVLALYPEETRTDNAGLVLALRNLPMMTMGYTMEQLIELRDAVKTAIPAFQLENNQLILDTAAKKATDYAATLDASEETGTAAQMEAYNTLTYYASEEVLAQIDATSYDAVMEYSQTIDAMLAQYQPAIEKEKAVMAATTAVAEAQATLAAGGTDEAGLADAIAKVNTILGEINMWDTEYTVADLTAAVEAMEAAEEAFVKANAFAAGTYYMKNVAAGKFFVAANNWGTRASLGEHGLDIKVEDLGNGKYALNTQVKPAKNNKCYLTSGGFVDGSDNAADGALSLVKQGDGIYAITFDGTNYMGYDGTTVLNLGLTDPTAEAAHWQFITKEEMIAAMEGATVENPADATFFIVGHDFCREDNNRNNTWQGGAGFGGGDHTNWCAEKWNANFDIYQDLTGLPNGYYTLTAQGFYRAGGGGATATDQHAILYAGNVSTPLANILAEAGDAAITGNVSTPEGYGNVPNNMESAGIAFAAGLYADHSLTVQVTDGTLRVGVKKETLIDSDWTIFDNFELYYVGTEDPEAQYLALAVDSLNTLIAEATAWKAELNAADEFHAQVIGMLDQMIPAAQAVADARESLETVNSMIFDVYSALGTYKPMVEQYDAKVAASAAIEEAKALLATYTEYTDAAGFVAAIANAENALTDVNMGMVTLEELTAAVEAMKVAQEAFVKENTPVITEVSVSLTHTASSYCEGDANVYKSTVDTEKEYINNSAFNGTWQGAAYAEFSVLLPEGISIKSATLTWTGIGESRNTRNTDVYYVNAGNAIDYAAMQGGAEKVNLEATKITSVTFPKGTSAVFTTDVTSAVETVVAAGQNYIIFKFTGNPGGGHLAGKADAANAPVLTLETADASTMTTYTVKYVDGAGAELKTADVYSILIGETAALADENKAAIYNEDKSAKYIYASCDKESLVTVADSASNVITATFREAAKYNYTVETTDDSGSLMITMGSYSGFEGENVVAPYYAYVLNEADSTLYESAKNGKEYNKYVDLTQDDMKVQVNYTPTTIKNVVYYQEAENVEGLTKITTGNTAIRSSNSASAYAADADVVLTTLAPGKYKLAAVIYDATKALNSEFCFIAGTDTILKAVSTAANWTNCASEEFTLTANTAISLAKGGSSSKGVDFFYIQKTGDVELPAKVAYLNQKGDANDAIYDALVAAGYAVDSLAYADSTLTAEMIEANLAGYDVVVLGGSTGSGAALAKTYTQLLGKVNVLSTKAFWYAAPGDGGSKGTNPGSADAPSLSIAKAAGYEGHPIYAGIEGDEFAVFNDMGKSTGRYLQGNGSFGSNTPEQATIGTTLGADCIGEAWVDGFGWIIIPVDGLQPSGYLTADGAQLFVNAVEYLIAGEQYEGPNAIEGVLVEGAQWPADIYDLSGRMVKKAATSLEGLQKGLYIINGKKVLVK